MANDAKFNFYLNRQGARGQKGEKGDQGFSPSVTVNKNTADEYTLLIQNEYDSFVTDNIRPTYDDRGGTYVRVDRANNVQYFGSADIATTANYGEVKLATEDDVATGSTADNDSSVVTAGILKGVKVNILADTVTLTTDQTITGFKTFDKGLYANNIIQARGELSYYSQTYRKKVFEAVNDSVTINGSLAVDGDVTFYGNINTASGVRANFQSITAKSVKVNNKDVATADTVEAIQSDLNIAKQDIIEAQGDIDNLQMNKQNKLTAGSGITIDADNVISATGGVLDLPIASSTTLGGIKVGENLTISEDGTLSATSGSTGDVSAAGNNTFTGENTFNGAVNLNGVSIAENLTVTGNLTSNGEINAVSIKTTGLRSDDIQTTTNKKYLTEVDVDNQTIQVVDGKLHANLDESALANKQDKLTAVSPVNIATKVLSPTVGWTVSSSSMQSIYKEHIVNNGTSLSGSNTTMCLSSDSEYPIKSYVAMPYTVGQVIKYRQNRSRSTQTTLVLGDIIDGKIYPILINSAIGNYSPQYTTALFDGTQELTKEVMTNGIGYSSTDSPGPINQSFINEATFGCLQNAGTKLVWHVFTPRDNNHGDYGNVTYTNLNGHTIDDLVGKIKYAIILAGKTSLVYTPDQFGVYENTLSSYSNISDYQALSPNLFDLSKNEVQTQISTLPATISSLGVVKPDGTTITITDDGTISAVGGGTPSDDSTTLQQGTQFTLNLTGNGTLGGSTPACTGSSYENGHPYYYAFKGATSSTPTKELWGPSSAVGNQYLILDCVTPIALQSFRWTNGDNSQERFPVIVFKGSNDNSNYTTLGTYNTQNATDDSVTIENYTPYRYYRFDFPQAASWGKIGFISMSGFNRYNILNIGDGLDVVNGQLVCASNILSDSNFIDFCTANADAIKAALGLT